MIFPQTWQFRLEIESFDISRNLDYPYNTLILGISVSRIETVKDWGDRNVALCHFGSNQFVREVYTDIMFHHLTILNKDGSENTAEEVVQDIGGPLCFQG